jgi:hypothetical protein
MPKNPPKNNKGPVNLMILLPLITKLAEASGATRRTKSAYVEMALENQMRADGFLPPIKKVGGK